MKTNWEQNGDKMETVWRQNGAKTSKTRRKVEKNREAKWRQNGNQN